jgi:hypothetical protein
MFMTRVTLTLLIAVCAASTAFAQARTPGEYIVSADTLNIRLAPGTSAKVKGKLYQGQKVEVLEVNNGWARISRYYDGSAEGLSGNVARWVFATHLAPRAAPPPPVKPRVEIEVDVNSPVYQAIESSDDLAVHKGIFVQVSEELVKAGQCKLSDFRDIGGWWRSAAHKPEPVYYTYCGGATNEDRIYLNTDTGETFR